jgi:dephospho-CoA kinase
MKIIGLTGGSGAGKGEVCAILQKYGIPSVNTDAVYHELLRFDAALQNELIESFGFAILDDMGTIDRKKLAAAVFSGDGHAARLHTLNAITHKYIMAKTWELIKDFEKSGARAAVIDAPQLFESNMDVLCDCIIGVTAPEAIRLERIPRRDNLTEKQARERMKAQLSESFFREHTDHLIENNGDLPQLYARLEALIKTIKTEVM